MSPARSGRRLDSDVSETDEIFPDRQVAVDRGCLELPPDAKLHNLILTFSDEIDVLAENDAAGSRRRLAADYIEQGRFACPVRTNHNPQLVVVDNKVEIIERLKAVVIDDHTFEIDDGPSFGHVSVLPPAPRLCSRLMTSVEKDSCLS